MADDPYIGAAVDVGSNSVHLLVCRLRDGRLEVLRDESALLGLGDVVDREGSVTADARAALVGSLRSYRDAARAIGAQQVTLIGTEPLRRAGNSGEVMAEVEYDVGLPLHVLSEHEEGLLTYIGVTGGRPQSRSLLVVDIGGGSSEIVLFQVSRPLQVISLPSGSARLSRGIVEHDPPTADEFDRLLLAAHRLADRLPEAHPARAVFVGGTATNLARLGPLRRDGLALAYRWLGSLTAAQLAKRFGVNLRRAGQLPAGAAIVDALLAHYTLDGAKVSEASLRDGAIIAAARLGADWPGRLAELAAESAWP
jgi:exopolyphosphatase / guanosine-5'-triphosphate,3'-diphosphate pyrophosphatase